MGTLPDHTITFQVLGNQSTFTAICSVPHDHDLHHFLLKANVCFWFSTKMCHSEQYVHLMSDDSLNDCNDSFKDHGNSLNQCFKRKVIKLGWSYDDAFYNHHDL